MLLDVFVDVVSHYRLLVGKVRELHKVTRDGNGVDRDKPENILHDESQVDDVRHQAPQCVVAKRRLSAVRGNRVAILLCSRLLVDIIDPFGEDEATSNGHDNWSSRATEELKMRMWSGGCQIAYAMHPSMFTPGFAL